MGPLNGFLFDSTVVIDCLNGIAEAWRVLDESREASISSITWIEVMAGVRGPGDELRTREFLDSLHVLPLSSAVAEEAVLIRRERRLKLPDAVIWATARVNDLVLVTRNTRDFPASDPAVHVPYRR